MTAVVDDERLRAFCAAASEVGPVEACRQFGVARSTGYRWRARAAARGLDGSLPAVLPPGQMVKGVSTLYDRSGAVAATWVKTRAEAVPLEDLLAAVRDAFADYKGAAVVPPAPENAPADICRVFPIADLHLGMHAWARETGAPYDLDIAERVLLGALGRAFARTGTGNTAIILGLGDFTHADNNSARTPNSGHALDVDTRHAKVKMVAVKLMIAAVDMALRSYENVIVRILPGNHDEETAAALAVALAVFYESSERVTVDCAPGLFWFYRWGRCLLGATHGHTVKQPDLPGIMAATRPEDWGASKWRYFWHGHIHHFTRREIGGVICESLQALCARDAYHAAHGYQAGRSLPAITLHRTRGEIDRVTVNIPNDLSAPEDGEKW